MPKKLSAAEETRRKNAAMGQSSKDELRRALDNNAALDGEPGRAAKYGGGPATRKLIEQVAGKRRPPAAKKGCDD